jgi:hypothetical protein
MIDKWVNMKLKSSTLVNIIPSEVSHAKKTEIVCSPSYADFRSRASTAMLLDLGHMLRGEHIWEVWGQV